MQREPNKPYKKIWRYIVDSAGYCWLQKWNNGKWENAPRDIYEVMELMENTAPEGLLDWQY